MSTQLQNNQISLKELVKNIENGLYTIPKFQRNFVWKKSDIEDLGDSLIRGYPISSMLTMSMAGNLSVGYEPLKTNGYKIAKDTSNEGIYVLDGQQRITSIAKIFNNFDGGNTYYFDLYAILNEKFPDDDISKFLDEENKGKILRSKETSSFCRSFNDGKKDFQPTRANYRFISGKIVVEEKFGSIINKFLRNFKTNDEIIDKYNDYLTALFGAINSYGIQVTEINPSADLGLICRVFEKVNSTGIKLTTFDLINAKSFNSEKINQVGGLAAYLSNSINEYYDNQVNKNKSFINDFISYDKESATFKDLSRIIRSLYLYDCIENGKNPYLTQSGLLSKDSDFWLNSWENKKKYFFHFMELLNKENLTGLLPSSYLEYILSIVFSYPNVLNSNHFIKLVKKNGLALSIMSTTVTKSEIETFELILNYAKKINNKEETSGNCQFIKFDLNDNILEKCFQGQRAFKCIMYIMTEEHHRGKFTIDIVGENIKNHLSIDEHHIIPKAKSKNKGDIFKSIINISPLNSLSNREDIKDNSPSIYFNEIKNKLGNNYKHALEQNLIPDIDLIEKDEISFLEQRKSLISEYIYTYFN